MNFLKGLQNWQETDIVVYKAMHNGPSFKNMIEKQQGLAITGIIFKTGVISGCPLPNDENHRKELSIEMQKFMNEHKDFSKLTFEEVIMAFRFNAAGLLAGEDNEGNYTERVKHWQNMFNLDFLGEVLRRYLIYKKQIIAKAERDLISKNLFEQGEIVDLTEDQIIQLSRDEWARTMDLMFLESRAYDILFNRGVFSLTKEQKNEVISKARIKINNICQKYNDFYQFERDPRLESVIAKKVALAEYFNDGPVKDIPYERIDRQPQMIFDKL